MIALNYAYGMALFFGLVWAAIQPDRRWIDSGDCRRICLHTVRAMSNHERHALWRMRAALLNEFPQCD